MGKQRHNGQPAGRDEACARARARRGVFGALIGAGVALCLTLLASMLAIFLLPVQAAEGDWKSAHNSRVRTVAGADPSGAEIAYYALIDIELVKGWKTYWRHPGDAGGIPPAIDLGQSQNIARSVVMFPTPKRIVDEVGTTLGYKQHARLPIRIYPKDPAKPVKLAVNLFYGVCKEICVPTEVQLTLTFTPSQLRAFPAVLATALAKVPKQVPLESARQGVDGLKLVDAVFKTGQNEQAVVFTIQAGKSAKHSELFVTGEDGVMAGVAMPVGPAKDGVQQFRVPLYHDHAVAVRGKRLRLIVSDGINAIETVWRLPAT